MKNTFFISLFTTFCITPTIFGMNQRRQWAQHWTTHHRAIAQITRLDNQIRAINLEECTDGCCAGVLTAFVTIIGSMPLIQDLSSPNPSFRRIAGDLYTIPRALGLGWVCLIRPYYLRAAGRREAQRALQIKKETILRIESMY